MLSVPFNFGAAHESRAEILKTYFGDYEANAPLGLLQKASHDAPFDFVKAGARIFVLNGELDPEDEILKPRDAFVKAWLELTDNDSRGALAVDWMPGHNHISPFASLSTGIEAEEAWGYQVVAFCDNIRKFDPR